MSHLMKLAEALREIAEECSKSEIEQALSLCRGFADRVSGELDDATEYPEFLGQSIAARLLPTPKVRRGVLVGRSRSCHRFLSS
jgi:hypothetical protein